MAVKKSVRADREQRRDKAVELLNEAKAIIDDLAEEMRNAFEAMPEGLQNSEQGQRKGEAADTLEGIDIESTVSSLEGVEF